MKTYCIKDHITGQVFKVFLTEEEFQDYLKKNPYVDECINCVECDDASSITLE
jgi:peptide methionine sulfoxide reductase MsrA